MSAAVNKDAKSERERAERALMSRMIVLLQAVQHAWRNEAMHFGSDYEADQAREILIGTRSFLRGMAAGLAKLE